MPPTGARTTLSAWTSHRAGQNSRLIGHCRVARVGRRRRARCRAAARGVARRRTREEAFDRKTWLAVAPGRVEPWSGEIRIGSAADGRAIGEVLVKVNDTVFAGEALIRLNDDEVRNRHAKAELQDSLRKRARPAASRKAADRRKHEDAVGDGESAVVEARAAVDRAAAAQARRRRFRRRPRDRAQDARERARAAAAAARRARQVRGRRADRRADRPRRAVRDGADRSARRRSRPRQPDRARADRRHRAPDQHPRRRARLAVGACSR